MRKYLFICLIFCTGLIHKGFAQNCPGDSAYIKYCVEVLASDSLCGRKPGSPQDMMAAQFVANQFKILKIKPFDKNSYFREFTYTYDSSDVSTRNVVAAINNKAEKSIIIAAHYDHLGYGGKRSRSYGKHEIHNGADDNASGVALMLALARKIKTQGPKKFNYIFIAFSGHEDGLFGSAFYTADNASDLRKTALMINLDMLGRADSLQPVVFAGSNDTSLLSGFISCKIPDQNLTIKSRELPEGDHTPFAGAGIPVLFLTTGMHDDYHKVSDDAEKINFSEMLEILRLIAGYISEF